MGRRATKQMKFKRSQHTRPGSERESSCRRPHVTSVHHAEERSMLKAEQRQGALMAWMQTEDAEVELYGDLCGWSAKAPGSARYGLRF